MPRIRCFYDECVFLEKGFCGAPLIELDPEDGCLTYSEDPGDLVKQNFLEVDEDESEDLIEDTWEDAGFEEVEDLNFEEDDDY